MVGCLPDRPVWCLTACCYSAEGHCLSPSLMCFCLQCRALMFQCLNARLYLCSSVSSWMLRLHYLVLSKSLSWVTWEEYRNKTKVSFQTDLSPVWKALLFIWMGASQVLWLFGKKLNQAQLLLPWRHPIRCWAGQEHSWRITLLSERCISTVYLVIVSANDKIVVKVRTFHSC